MPFNAAAPLLLYHRFIFLRGKKSLFIERFLPSCESVLFEEFRRRFFCLATVHLEDEFGERMRRRFEKKSRFDRAPSSYHSSGDGGRRTIYLKASSWRKSLKIPVFACNKINVFDEKSKHFGERDDRDAFLWGFRSMNHSLRIWIHLIIWIFQRSCQSGTWKVF